MPSVSSTAWRSSHSHCSAIKSALVVRGGALGDFILTLPIIRALRSEFDVVEVLANGKFAALTSGTSHALDDPALAPFFVPNADSPQSWRDYFACHDLVISYLHDPANFFETNVRACRVGNFLVGPHRMRPGSHSTEQLARPLAELGISITEFVPRIEPGHSERTAARQKFPLPRVALHPGSGSARKNWPIENWIALIDHLLASGQRLVIIGGEADETEVACIRRQFGNCLAYAIGLPMRQLAAILAGTNFIGHDSGVSHLAAAAGSRCLILFGPTDAKVWAPRNPDARVLIAPHGDLKQLTIAQVRDALKGDRSRFPSARAESTTGAV